MSSGATPDNIARLLSAFKLQISAVPDYLKCAGCKSVLKDACQVPCGCKFCRACIDDVMGRGAQFCPGGSQECAGTPLSTAVPDYWGNRSISRLTAKCPQSGCSHECPLVNMEGHLRVCPRKSVDCPFRELGCLQGELAAEEMSGHLQQESRGHSEILIGLLVNMSQDVEVLKLGDKASKRAIEIVQRELVLKDEQIGHLENENKSICDENKSMKDEIKSINDEIKSIRDQFESIEREKEVLCDRVRQLSEKLEREIDERRDSGERYSTMVTAMTAATGSDREASAIKMEPVKYDIGSTNLDGIQSIKDNINCAVPKSIRTLAGLGRGEARCEEWLIDAAVGKTRWGCKTSDSFTDAARPYTYRLASWNDVGRGALWIQLLILAGPSDDLLEWPFRGTITVTVSSRDKPEACTRLTRQCLIKRPPHNDCNWSDSFVFRHSDLKVAGLDMTSGVRVSCQIVTMGANDIVSPGLHS